MKNMHDKKVTETQNVSVNLVVVGKNSSNKNETNVGLKGVIMSASKRVVPVNKKNTGASQENCPRQGVAWNWCKKASLENCAPRGAKGGQWLTKKLLTKTNIH